MAPIRDLESGFESTLIDLKPERRSRHDANAPLPYLHPPSPLKPRDADTSNKKPTSRRKLCNDARRVMVVVNFS